MVSQKRLKELLTYDPESGVFTWNATGMKDAGSIAGTTTSDKQQYIRITIDKRKYYAQQLAFVWMTGAPATKQPDHINGNGCDNRWCNLRDVTPSENCRNRRQRSDNTSGANGVRYLDGRWRAEIKVHGKRTHLGMFSTIHQAIEARLTAQSESGGFSETHGTTRPLHGLHRK